MAHYSECTCSEEFLSHDPTGHEEGCPCAEDDDDTCPRCGHPADGSSGHGSCDHECHAPVSEDTNGDPEELVTIETMPDCHRASHRAANNWGNWPMNGAERADMTRAAADEIVADDPDGYAWIVGPCTDREG